MNAAAVKHWGVIVAVAAVAVAGTWLYSSSAHSVRVAEVTSSGCGPAEFGLPLALLGETAGSLPVAVGPIASDSLTLPLRLTFDPSLSTTDRELTMSDGALTLPTMFGRTPSVPERISINCRDGAVVTVRYTGGSSAATTFNVTVADAADAAGLVESPLPGDDTEETAEN